ncbi:outer membrane receptor protein [Acidovorax sp. CF316]|uniref:TonB-dependent receptor domain-containing protein n=1 Tax=Acidovorax sp. CF316 TaxID=1144317 RepID=UPI00026BCA7D|nr:TonB-dependent receptor [Acidovorax sp. CF316]EJE54300.1 outer membrane receptor protein [Acidovorax sp. CF316]
MRHPTMHLSALAALLALAWPPSHAAVPPGAAAEIVGLQGPGEQRAAATPDWKPARQAQALAAGDFVRTREAARMALLFADDTQLRLHQNTVLQVKAVATTAQPMTTLMLSAGRAWTQTRRADGSRLTLETPAATAAIRGTDWDIEVAGDGRTLITVLSGTVEFGNAQGQVSVAANEAAYADVGQAPVKMVLGQPRDRIQWVNALRADALPSLAAQGSTDGGIPAALEPVRKALARRDAAAASGALAQVRSQVPAGWAAAMESAVALQAGDLQAARSQLARQVDGAGQAPVLVAWLMQSDLQLLDGDGPAAVSTLRTALARHWPAHPALVAQLARVQLLTDRVDEAQATLAGAGTGDASLALVRAELARRQGDGPAAIAAYTEATVHMPGDARTWQGLGSAHVEREETDPARKALGQALALDAQAPGAQGERGTLATFVNQFTEAGLAFGTALRDNPADYVALTGQGLMHLKRGQTQAALDDFLRAGVMEPRYARAKVWTAVAYYQLGRTPDALATLRQASALDDKDPLPYLLLAQIQTDLFQPGDAVESARAAVQRMPYLKSLNQVANDQKGSANLGASLAFFGMEDWALELAQQSFSPYWGGSHLFLADRYRGEFAKNSALFQGFLTDPMAFGASQLHSSLLQRPGSHGALGLLLDRDFYRMSAPSLTLNGMDNSHLPVSWFLKAQSARARRSPIDVGVFNVPAFHDPSGTANIGADVLTVGLGLQPSERLNLFAYANQYDVALQGRNRLDLWGDGSEVRQTTADNRARLGVAGLSYRWSPVEQTWLKLGRSRERNRADNFPTLFLFPPLAALGGLKASPEKALTYLQLRHSVDPQPGQRWSVALEHVAEKQSSEVIGYGPLVRQDSAAVPDILVFAGVNEIDRRYTGLTLAGSQQFTPDLLLDGALGLQQIRHRVRGGNAVGLLIRDVSESSQARRSDTERVATPRVGLVFSPAAGTTLRMAYQDWLRPLSASTLTSVETAGIPVEDRMVEAGGRHRRTVAQLGMEIDGRTFLSLRADHLRVRNPGVIGVDLRTPSMPFLEEMRNAQLINLSTTDVLEGTPGFEEGTLQALGAGVNRMFSRQWSGYAKYLYQHSSSQYLDSTSNSMVRDLRIPYIPRHTAVIGATWASAQRVYLSARAVYRSERFEDKQNLTRRPPGWNLDLVGYWETQDKHWVVGAGVLNLFGDRTPRQTVRYVIDARYRF